MREDTSLGSWLRVPPLRMRPKECLNASRTVIVGLSELKEQREGRSMYFHHTDRQAGKEGRRTKSSSSSSGEKRMWYTSPVW